MGNGEIGRTSVFQDLSKEHLEMPSDELQKAGSRVLKTTDPGRDNKGHFSVIHYHSSLGRSLIDCDDKTDGTLVGQTSCS